MIINFQILPNFKFYIPKWNIFRRGKLSKYYFMKKNAPCSVLFQIINKSRGGSQNI